MTDETKPNDRTVEQPDDEAVVDTSVTAVAAVTPPETRADPPGEAPFPSAGDEDPHANLAAYLLDSLPEDERAAFAAHFTTCAVCQKEAATLAPIVGSLPGLLVLDPSSDLRSPEITPLPADLEPSPDLRDRLLAAARGESTPPAAAAEQPVDVVPEAAEAERADGKTGAQQAAVEPTSITTARRPPGRILPGASARPTSFSTQAWQTVSRVSWATRLAALFAIIAVGAVIWALALQGRVNDLEDENQGLEDTIARIEGSSATVASLAPAGQGPADSSGELFFSLPAQEGWIVVEGMNPLPSDQAYQLWYIKEGDPAPKPGPTIIVDENGTGVAQVAPDAPTYNQVAVTVEPRTGSQAPTTDPVLAGNLSGAAG
jgi:Anti-sigma-K factor rskA, C-terminal/Putative zinc-finger